jgi:PEP-CTERM motif
VRHLRALTLISLALGTVGWLMADSMPDPIIRYTIPGGHSVDLCTPDSDSSSCSQTIGVIGEDGFGTFDVHNPATNSAVISESWFFETDNLDQAFTASTTDFTTVTMERQFNCDGDCSQGGTLEVDFFGIAEGGTPGSAFLPAIECDGEGCSSEEGFTPGSSVVVDSTFAQDTDPDSCCDGLQPDEHGSLALSSDVPEPGSLVLLLGAAGLLGLKRKLWRR